MFRAVFLAASFVWTVGHPAWAQDVAAGEKTFFPCRQCHQVGPKAKIGVGPVLNGIVGRKAGTYAGYNYSAANKDSNLTWDEATLETYLQNPQSVVKGTKMSFAGLKTAQDAKDVIAFLKQYQADGNKAP
jgi:cytochrome c